MPCGSGERKLRNLLSATLMKNCAVAEFGSEVRAIASVPGVLRRPALLAASASLATGGRVGFW
jgi:hypothetical protein